MPVHVKCFTHNISFFVFDHIEDGMRGHIFFFLWTTKKRRDTATSNWKVTLLVRCVPILEMSECENVMPLGADEVQ